MRSADAGGANANQCPIAFALDLFGDRWTLVVLRDLVFKGKRYYGEFLSSPEGISTNILADRLARLETNGLVSKQRDPANQTKFIYRLTRKGADLVPLLLEMTIWSSRSNPQPDAPSSVIEGAPKDLLRRAASDRSALIAEIVERVELS